MAVQVLDFAQANCKNCYRCVRTCKVKAIKVINHQARIEKELCIGCGECFLVCSQKARKIHSQVDTLKTYIEDNEEVIVTIAPSYRGYVYDGIDMLALLKSIGVARIEETAIAADYISREYMNYIESCEKNIHLTSACPSINSLVEKYYAQHIDKLLPITTPLLLHGQMLKKEYPNSKVVFVGPCLAKKTEVLSKGAEGLVDAVITFDELIENFSTEGLARVGVDKKGSRVGQVFARSGGISEYIDIEGYRKIKVEGVAEAIKLLEAIDTIESKVIVEINACKGGCLNGPGGEGCSSNYYERLFNLDSIEAIEKELSGDYDYHRQFVDKSVKYREVSEEEIGKILVAMEKHSIEDQLNCAACGYNTCRDKAIAVYNGMSTIDMCLPFMRNRAERISNEIFVNSPNGVFILDKELKVTELNQAAMEKFYLDEGVLGKGIAEFIQDEDFVRVLDTGENIIKKRTIYKNYSIIALKSIIYLEEQNALLVIITNITKEEKQKEELRTVKQNTIELTQGVIEKQMRVAQEIASLLGETTAETKVALTKLKNLVEGEI